MLVFALLAQIEDPKALTLEDYNRLVRLKRMTSVYEIKEIGGKSWNNTLFWLFALSSPSTGQQVTAWDDTFHLYK